MTDDKSLELHSELEQLDWTDSLASLDHDSIQEYLLSKVAGEDVMGFYLDAETGDYSALKWDLRIILVTDLSLFEFLFNPTLRRYDVSRLRDIFRLEERIESEESLDGPPRNKVTLSVLLASGSAVSLQLARYDQDGQRLTSFADALKSARWGLS